MKKYTCLLLCLPFLLSGCASDEYYEDDYEHDYEAGYDKGYAEGYNEGYEEGYNLGRDDERIDPSNVLSEEELIIITSAALARIIIIMGMRHICIQTASAPMKQKQLLPNRLNQS